jgi:hypothetical protein
MPFHILGTMPINMDNIEYISSSESDFDSDSESRVMPITELAIQRPQRRRLGINSIFYHRPVAQALYEKWSTETAVMFASASAANGGSKPKPPRKLQVRSQSSSSDASPTLPCNGRLPRVQTYSRRFRTYLALSQRVLSLRVRF